MMRDFVWFLVQKSKGGAVLLVPRQYLVRVDGQTVVHIGYTRAQPCIQKKRQAKTKIEASL